MLKNSYMASKIFTVFYLALAGMTKNFLDSPSCISVCLCVCMYDDPGRDTHQWFPPFGISSDLFFISPCLSFIYSHCLLSPPLQEVLSCSVCLVNWSWLLPYMSHWLPKAFFSPMSNNHHDTGGLFGKDLLSTSTKTDGLKERPAGAFLINKN